jgi:hypothetical protein
MLGKSDLALLTIIAVAVKIKNPNPPKN